MVKTLVVALVLVASLSACEPGWPRYPDGRRVSNLNCAPTGSRIEQTSTACASDKAGGVTTQKDIERSGADISRGTAPSLNPRP
jgi:hypothetical protein